ncbi:hypothetical protein [Advenella sp. FME57]|uniref:hypothetical protein n=1 Tax=Advenella sp. FME57 TaxID=2742604 RepID=UPI001865A42B
MATMIAQGREVVEPGLIDIRPGVFQLLEDIVFLSLHCRLQIHTFTIPASAICPCAPGHSSIFWSRILTSQPRVKGRQKNVRWQVDGQFSPPRVRPDAHFLGVSGFFIFGIIYYCILMYPVVYLYSNSIAGDYQ